MKRTIIVVLLVGLFIFFFLSNVLSQNVPYTPLYINYNTAGKTETLNINLCKDEKGQVKFQSLSLEHEWQPGEDRFQSIMNLMLNFTAKKGEFHDLRFQKGWFVDELVFGNYYAKYTSRQEIQIFEILEATKFEIPKDTPEEEGQGLQDEARKKAIREVLANQPLSFRPSPAILKSKTKEMLTELIGKLKAFVAENNPHQEVVDLVNQLEKMAGPYLNSTQAKKT